MKLSIAILFAGLLLGSTDQPKETPRLQTVMVTDRNEIQKLLKTHLPGPQIYGGGIVDAEHFRVGALRREAPGEVEIHRDDTDIFYVLAGSATIVTGGQLVQRKDISAAQSTAKSIQGGVAHEVHAGDVILIAKQQPHWFKKVTPSIEYLVIKVQ
jgi:quercetin dioxygenase-like cupin family protein